MKQLSASFAQASGSGAPALTRGLGVLAALGEKSPLTLENLVRQLRIPKASVFRLLETLQQMGLVRKTPEKSYEPLWSLQPIVDEQARVRSRMAQSLSALSEAAGCTAEWFEPSEAGMNLIYQKSFESEVRVQARPGFIREWNSEFEAVARLGHAFARTAPRLAAVRAYAADGVIKPLSIADARKLLQHARANLTAFDVVFNTNGVRRTAAAVLLAGAFFGVLGLAECCRFPRKSNQDFYLKLLRQTVESL